jgi:hypothetical protein
VLDQRAGGALGARRGGRVPAGNADRDEDRPTIAGCSAILARKPI